MTDISMTDSSAEIAAVCVNHNTSPYAELMLRSLFACHSIDTGGDGGSDGLRLALTLYDNDSQDDQRSLRAYADSVGVPVLPSGFSTQTANNSHGEVLRNFVLAQPDCSHYLFLDADVCFVQPGTIAAMLAELSAAPDAFGIGARMSWDGEEEIPERIWRENPDVYTGRLHPCCALVRNTPLFRAVVEEIGLSCATMRWAEGDEYLDTFKLMTKVMKAYGQRHILSSKMVLHFFAVSYAWEPTKHLVEAKAAQRDELLTKLRGDA